MTTSILVVDDETDLEMLVRQKMRREIRRGEFEFDFAHNGVQALNWLKENKKIDIVLTDINMPEMDGLTLLENIPQVNNNLNAVVISAYGDMKNIRLAMNRGAFDFITKPVDFDDLRITLRRSIEQLASWREATESKERLASIQIELDTAARMQQSILPRIFPNNEKFDIYAAMEPAKEVGGDFYDFTDLEEGRVGISIADVSGKGIAAGLFMMNSRTLLKGACIGLRSPSEVMAEINENLSVGNDAMMFVTLWYGVFDPKENTLHYSNGGHNLPLVVRKDGSIEELPGTGDVALGLMGGLQFSSNSIQLNRGDKLVLYTDGVNEAELESEELLGMDRFKSFFDDDLEPSAEAITKRVFSGVREFVGDYHQTDDITCLTLNIKDD